MALIWKHFKGGLYTSITTSAIASTDIKENEPVTIYVSLQDGNIYVRASTTVSEHVRTDKGLRVGPRRFEILSGAEIEAVVKKRMRQLGLTKKYAKKKAKR